MTKIKEIIRIIFEKKEDDVKVKEKWSLKKKLILGGGFLSGIIVGIFAYGKKQEMEFDEDEDYYEDDIDYTVTEDGFEDVTINTEEVEVEIQE